jgi:hypothetical protein
VNVNGEPNTPEADLLLRIDNLAEVIRGTSVTLLNVVKELNDVYTEYAEHVASREVKFDGLEVE